MFFLMCLSVSWFLFCAGNAVFGPARSDVIFWYRLSSLGFASFFALNLNFYILYVFRIEFDLRYLLLYIPVPLIIYSTFFSTSLFENFAFSGEIWKFLPAYSSPWFWGYLIYYFSYTLTTVVIIFLKAVRTGLREDRIMAFYIIGSTFLTLFIGSAADFLFTKSDSYTLPPSGPLFMSIYIFGLWYIMLKYGFMTDNPIRIIEGIIDHIHDVVFVIDESFRFIYINTEGRRIAQQYGGKDPFLLCFTDITASPDDMRKFLRRLKDNEEYSVRIEYKLEKKSVFTDSTILKVVGSGGNFQGYEIVSRINRGINDFINAYKITRRELQILTLCLSASATREISDNLCIAERTVETHICNIFNKTGVNSRIELFTLANRYGMIPNQ